MPSRAQKHTRSLYQIFQNVYPTLCQFFKNIYLTLYQFMKMHTRPYTNYENCENWHRSLYQNRENRYRSLYQNRENRYPSRWHVPVAKICIVPPRGSHLSLASLKVHWFVRCFNIILPLSFHRGTNRPASNDLVFLTFFQFNISLASDRNEHLNS